MQVNAGGKLKKSTIPLKLIEEAVKLASTEMKLEERLVPKIEVVDILPSNGIFPCWDQDEKVADRYWGNEQQWYHIASCDDKDSLLEGGVCWIISAFEKKIEIADHCSGFIHFPAKDLTAEKLAKRMVKFWLQEEQ